LCSSYFSGIPRPNLLIPLREGIRQLPKVVPAPSAVPVQKRGLHQKSASKSLWPAKIDHKSNATAKNELKARTNYLGTSTINK
jgi:hypothetical protein